jgi:predicted DNA-binding transcriptional regulator AlpA
MSGQSAATTLLPPGLIPRFLTREQAAAYLGVGVTTFDHEVAKGMWPRPMRRGARAARVTWDRMALDAVADRAAGLSAPPPPAGRPAKTSWDDL